MGAVQFIENLDRTVLHVSDQDFEQNVEASVAAMAERPKTDEPTLKHEGALAPSEKRTAGPSGSPARSSHRGNDGEGGAPSPAAGFFQTIQRPLSNIGRIFSDEPPSATFPAAQRHPEGAAIQHEAGARLSVPPPPPPKDDARVYLDEEGAASSAVEASQRQQADYNNVVEYA